MSKKYRTAPDFSREEAILDELCPMVPPDGADDMDTMDDGDRLEAVPSFVCRHCGARFRQRLALRLHFERSHRGGVVSPAAAAVQPEERTMETVGQTERPDQEQPGAFRCTVCGQEFETARGLRIHVGRTHTPKAKPKPRPFACDLCDYAAPTARGLARHKSIQHGASGASKGAEPNGDSAPTSQGAIRRECDAIRDGLLAKNAAYGDSALQPLRLFSRADPAEQLAVRIDDKLSRLMRGDEAARAAIVEDTVADLIGYLILWRVERRLKGGAA